MIYTKAKNFPLHGLTAPLARVRVIEEWKQAAVSSLVHCALRQWCEARAMDSRIAYFLFFVCCPL